MNPTAIVLALGLAAPVALTGCSKKSDSATSTASTVAAPAAARCPAGSSIDATGTSCKANGGGRVAALTWNGALGDNAQVLTLKNRSGMVLKGGSIAVWFYDRTGKRLDVAGAKRYALPGDAFGSNVKVGETRSIIFPLSKAGVPDGTAEIEGEVVKVTLVNADGTDGLSWKNDDLNVDERVMVAAPAAAAVATGAVRPAIRTPPPPPPPPHR